MPKTVTLLYGITEGEWHGRKFRAELKARGYRIADEPATADIIVTHSAGCYFVPSSLKRNQVVVLVDPIYWPGRSTLRRTADRVLYDVSRVLFSRKGFYLLHKTCWNLRYAFSNYRYNREIIRRHHGYDFKQAITHPRTIIIRNAGDTWLTPDLAGLQASNPHLQVHHLPGDHDDCWFNPIPYVDLLQSDA